MPWVVASVVGFGVGYFSDAAHTRRLQSELQRARVQLRSYAQPDGLPHVETRRVVDRSRLSRPAASNAPASLPFGFGVTREDWDQSFAMNRSSETGGYVLSYERPLTRKVAESVVKQFAEQTQSNNAVELNRVFAAHGIQPELSTQLQTHLARITEASMLSEIGIQQLQQARFDYDNRVRSALSPDDYLRYRQYEDAKPAEKEFGKLEDYAKAQGLAFDPNDQPAVVSLIQQFHAYTESSWHGPYDVVPDPAYGDVQVFARVNSEIVEIGDKAKQVDLAASTSGVSEAARNLLAAYYNRKIEDRQNALEDMRNPVRDPATLSSLLDRQLQASGVPVPLSTNRVP